MSVNQRFGMDQNKTAHFGKLFHTIDFETNENYSEREFLNKSKSSVCGTLCIGSSEFKITYHELSRLQETIDTALANLSKNYRLGGLRS